MNINEWLKMKGYKSRPMDIKEFMDYMNHIYNHIDNTGVYRDTTFFSNEIEEKEYFTELLLEYINNQMNCKSNRKTIKRIDPLIDRHGALEEYD